VTANGKIILVTGASGQLGRRLVPRLIDSGYNVRAHYRSAEKAEKYCPLGASPVIGDLLNPNWLMEATRDCQVVIHGAAKVSLRPGQLDIQRKINIEGTREVIAACKNSGVKRLIYISSIVTVGASANGNPIDEAADFNLGGFNVPYIDTKKEAEDLALQANGFDLEVVVVNPSIMISMPDREITVSDLRKIPRFLPAYFDFAINLVETEAVVGAIISTITRGRPGERYLLTGENVDSGRAFEMAEKYLGIRKPWLKIPPWFLIPVAATLEVVEFFRRKRPRFHRGLAKLARFKFVYKNEKAREELGFAPRPLESLIRDIVTKIREQTPNDGRIHGTTET
jgi:dihydroflavonol-4-reductase